MRRLNMRAPAKFAEPAPGAPASPCPLRSGPMPRSRGAATMSRPTTALAVALGLALAAPAWADPPEIKSITPFGIKRGEPAEITIAGANLVGHPRLVAPFGVAIDPATAEDTKADRWKLKLTAAAEAPVGVYPV